MRGSPCGCGVGQGRTDPGPCVELILEDDGGRLAIDACPVGVALRLASGGLPTGRASSDPDGPRRYGWSGARRERLPANADRRRPRRPTPGSGSPAGPRRRTPRAAARRRARRRRGPRRAPQAGRVAGGVAAAPQRRQRTWRATHHRRRGRSRPAAPRGRSQAAGSRAPRVGGTAGRLDRHGLVEGQRDAGRRASAPSTPSPARPRAALPVRPEDRPGFIERLADDHAP